MDFSFNYAGKKITHKDLKDGKIGNLTVTVKTKKYEEIYSNFFKANCSTRRPDGENKSIRAAF